MPKSVGYWGCSGMFSYCTSLLEAPELPSTRFSGGCYRFMFMNCTSLTQTPNLPSTSLTEECYKGMFKGCTSLVKAMDILPATRIASREAYAYMF